MAHRLCSALLLATVAVNPGLRSAPVPAPKDDRSPEEIQAARDDLRMLRQRAADPKRNPSELWKLWARFRMRHPDSPEYMQAAEVMSKVPSPLDKLDRSQIPAEDRPPWLPQEVVAVLGDQRGRSWGDFGRLTFSRDGKLLLSDWQAWDAATLRERPYALKGAVMAPEGKRAAVLGTVTSPEAKRHRYLDSFIRLLEMQGDEVIVRAEMQREGHRLDHLEWSPDGRLLLASGRIYPMFREGGHLDRRGVRQQTILCEVKANKLRVLHEIDVEPSGGSQAAFAVGGKYLVDNGGEKKALRLWDLRVDKPKLRSTISNDWQGGFSLSADGKTLAAPQPSRLRGRNAQAAAVWSLTEAGHQALCFFEGTWPSLYSLELSPDGTLLACLATETKGIWLCPLTAERRRELKAKDKLAIYYPLKFTPQTVRFYPDSSKLAIGGADRIIHLWDWKNGEKLFPHAGHRGDVSGISFSPDGRCLASAGTDGTIRLWGWHGRGVLERVRVDAGWPMGTIAFAPEGEMLAAYAPSIPRRKNAEKDTISFWGIRKDRLLHRENLEPHSEDQDFASMAFAARGKIFLTTGNGLDAESGNYSIATACLWDYTSLPPQLISRLSLEDAERKDDNRFTDVELSNVTLSPTGNQLAFIKGRRERSAEVWERRGESWRKAFDVKFDLDEGVSCLAFSMDGSMLLTARGSTPEREPSGRSYPLIRFWKARGRVGEIRSPLKDDGCGSIEQLVVSPDGCRIAACNSTRITIWDIPASTRLIEWKLPFSFGEVKCRFAPDGRHLATANPNGTVYVFRIPEQSGKP